VEDLLTVAPIELAPTETMGVLLCRPRASQAAPQPIPRQSGLREETIGSGPGPRAATAEGRSALEDVVQVQHAVALDYLTGIVEEDGAGVAAEEAHPFTQNHRGDIHRDLVDQTCRERLPAEVAGGHADETVAGELVGERDARLDRPGSVEGCVRVVGEPRLRQWPAGDTTSSSPAAGSPSQPFVVSNR
jgi:hypothetical protein